MVIVIVTVTVTAIVIVITITIINQWEASPQLDSSDVFGKRERRVWLALG